MMRTRIVLAVLCLAGAGACSQKDKAVEWPAEAMDDEAPYGIGVEIGKTYDYVLNAHCGVQWTRIDGTWWETKLLDDGNRNPPPGWGNPLDEGRLTIVDEATAEYAGGPDVTVTFTRTPATEPPFGCD